MTETKWIDLQLFGEGGGGEGSASASTGEGASAPGVNTAAPEPSYEDKLRKLGVPEDKIRKPKNRVSSTAPSVAPQIATAPTEVAPQQTAPAPTTEEKPTEGKASRMTWDEIMADPEYNKQMQNVVQGRLRSAKDAEAKLAKLAPAIELISSKYNLDPNNLDFDALNKAISDDDSYYEDKALEMGVPIETAKRIDQVERETARRQREESQNAERQKIESHLANLQAQGEALKATFPKFDLKAELQNPVFARMTSPSIGLSVEDAYYAVHRKEIQSASMQATAQITAKKLSNAIQSGMNRPSEAGTSSQAPSVTTFNYANASKEQREAFKASIRAAAAKGQKIYPGQYRPQ